MLELVLAGLLAGTVPLTGWETEGDAAVETVDGRETMRISAGTALRRDVQLKDGTIDFDLQVSRRRSFVYLTFRMQDEREYEEIYFRPHKSTLPDAIQYAPVYQGASAWQLYHGPGAAAAIGFEAGRWTPVRLVMQGARAALYVGDMTKPALVMPLARDPRAGFIGFGAFVPPGTPGAEVAARYSNLRVSETPAVDLSTLPMPPAVEEPGRIRSWAVSGPLSWTAGLSPSAPPADVAYRTVSALPNGLVELHRHVTVPSGSRELTAAARVRVMAASAGTRAFDLGFSDRATVFVNGTPVFSGEGSYSYGGRREGLITYDQARVYLPLRQGENELLVVVWDTFGGMGLMGRFPDMSGLTVEAR